MDIYTVETILQLDNYIKKELYIFGAGKVSRIMLSYLANKKIEIKSILVSCKENNPDEIMGIKVMQFDLIDLKQSSDSTIIVCVYENLQDEIVRYLRSKDIHSCVIMKDILINQIEYFNSTYDVEIIQKLNSLNNKVENLENLILQNGKKIEKHIEGMNEICIWHNAYEREVVRANWLDYLESENLREFYLNLVSNLDAESVSTINKILIRQKKYLNSEEEYIDFFSEGEKKELIKQKNEFWDEIIKVADDLFAYKNYLLNRNVFEISVFYYKHGVDKLANIQKIHGKSIIDVGGYVGDSVLVFEELNPQKIYTFEAVPEFFNEMRINLEINNISNCIAENIALSDYYGTALIHCNNSMSTMIERKSIQFEKDLEVQVTTLDKYVEEKKIDDIGLIKVDIEGSEPNFLRGAVKTIRRWRPTLLISIYHNGHDFFMIKPMIEKWNLGYKFQVYKPVNGNASNETLLIAEQIV